LKHATNHIQQRWQQLKNDKIHSNFYIFFDIICLRTKRE
jgi:hypothetical protein